MVGLVVTCAVVGLCLVLTAMLGYRARGKERLLLSRATSQTRFVIQMTVGAPDALDHLLYYHKFTFSSVTITKEGKLDAGKWGDCTEKTEDVMTGDDNSSLASINLVDAAVWLLGKRLRANGHNEDAVRNLVSQNRDQFVRMDVKTLAGRYLTELDTTEISGPH